MLDYLEDRKILLSSALDQLVMIHALNDEGRPEILRIISVSKPLLKGVMFYSEDW